MPKPSTAKQFARWLATSRDTLPAEILPLAERASLSLTQMELDPRANEQCPELRADNLSDIKAFHDACAARAAQP